VDITNADGTLEFPARNCDVLREVPLNQGEKIPGQLKIAVDCAWIWNCIALDYYCVVDHTVMVRLYRPGWRTVMVRSWNKRGRVKWVKAESLEEQEIAVDDLVLTWATRQDPLLIANNFKPPGWNGERSSRQDEWVFHSLAPGSISA